MQEAKSYTTASQMTCSTVAIDRRPSPRVNKRDDYDVNKHIHSIPAINNMLDVLLVSSTTRWMVDCALVDVATKHGGVDVFFTQSGGMKDSMMDVDFLGCPLLMLTKVNNDQNSRLTWPHANDTLPTGIVTFSKKDLCHPEPNHNRPLHVSVELRNKIIYCTLVDLGFSTNLLIV